MAFGIIGALLLALVVWLAMHRRTRRLEAELSEALTRPRESDREPRRSVVDLTDEEVGSADTTGLYLRRAREETRKFLREAEELKVQLKNARQDLRDALEKLDEYEHRYGPLPDDEYE